MLIYLYINLKIRNEINIRKNISNDVNSNISDISLIKLEI